MKKIYRIIFLIIVLIFLSTYSPHGFNLILKKDSNFLTIKKIEIVNNSLIKTKYITNNLTSLMQVYFYNKIISSKNDLNFVEFYKSFLKKINSFNKYNLDLESLLIEFNAKIDHG